MSLCGTRGRIQREGEDEMRQMIMGLVVLGLLLTACGQPVSSEVVVSPSLTAEAMSAEPALESEESTSASEATPEATMPLLMTEDSLTENDFVCLSLLQLTSWEFERILKLEKDELDELGPGFFWATSAEEASGEIQEWLDCEPDHPVLLEIKEQFVRAFALMKEAVQLASTGDETTLLKLREFIDESKAGNRRLAAFQEREGIIIINTR